MSNLLWGSSTDVGRLRELNEDAVYAEPPLFAVADGMGGHAAGEVASALALQELSALAGLAAIRPDDVLTSLASANRAILDWASTRDEALGMGTTVSGVCLGSVGGSPHWFVFNVGDSRVYRFEDDRLSQITTDHSELEELLASGALTPAEAPFYPRRNVVTRSLGTDPAPLPDLWVLPVGGKDTFLICSDGLTNEVDDDGILALMQSGALAQDVADALCRLAVTNGGRDNVSVVIVRFDDEVGSNEVGVATAPRPRRVEA
jgi:serine/threonine protein phosphatase PrpC